jgi:hypothetical protein
MVYNSKLARQLIRLVATSGINTLLGVLAMIAIYKLTRAPFLTILLSALAGYTYSIYSYNIVGFARGLTRPPYKRYMVVYSSSVVINLLLTRVGMSITGNFFLVQAIVLPSVVGLQWIASYFWAFRRQK